MPLSISSSNVALAIAAIPEGVIFKQSSVHDDVHQVSGGLVEKLDDLYRAADEAHSHALPFTVCKKGCSFCCTYIPISLFPAEVAYIEAKTGIVSTPTAEVVSGSCPFLRDGVCLIYAFRPYACRRHLNFSDTSEHCQTESPPTLTSIHFDEIWRTYLSLVANGEKSMDIRQAFSKEAAAHGVARNQALHGKADATI